MQESRTTLKKPNPFLYKLAAWEFMAYCKLHYKLKLTGEKPEGPAVVLCNHASNEDFRFVGLACAPNRVSFVASYHWFTFKMLSPLLNIMGVIPKYQFATDLAAMRKIQYAVKNNGGIVFIAPEGTIYANGKLGYISPSIAKMIRFLNVKVYASKIQGAGLGLSKWSKRRHNINHVSVDTKLIIKQEEVKQLTPDEIMNRITTALEYNDFEYQKEQNVISHDKDLAESFETMFYKCPHCGAEFEMSSSGNTVTCNHCGTQAVLQPNFRFKWSTTKQYFDNYIEWYDWQYDLMKKAVSEPDFLMSEEVDYGIDRPGANSYEKVGHGTITFSHDGWTYKGTKEGQEVEEHDDCKEVFLATLKKGIHFELPFKYDHCRAFYPADGNRSMKWHLASRAMSEISKS